jgi:uncharacterized protein involved in outer membrane biogenesis
MRALTYIGLGFGGLLLAAGAAAWGILHYIQTNDMRAWAEWGAAKAGVPVQFAGPVEIKLWPQVVVKTQGVKVLSLQGEGTLATVDALALQAAWGAGWQPWEGLQLRAIEAKNPTVNLTRSEAGVANWEAPQTPTAAAPAAEPTESPLKTLTAQGGMLASVRLAIANLNLTYADAQSGQRIEVKAMNIGARTQGTQATTTLNGTINGQPLQGELVADAADLANIPLKARLEGAGAALALEGRVTRQANQAGFAGMVNARSGNLQGTLKTLLGKAPAQAPASPAAITGDMVLKPEQITLRNFSARVGELLQARGDVDLTLGTTPSGKGTIAIQGDNLRALAELGSGTKQPNLPARPFNFQARLAGEETIEIRDLTFNLEPVLQLRGSMQITPRPSGQPNVATNLTLNAPSLQALLQAFGQTQTAPAQAVQATLNVKGAAGVYALEQVRAQLADLATLNLTGTADTRNPQPKVDLEAKLEGTNMAAAAAGFGVEGNLPSSGFSARAKVRGSGPYELEGLTINLPGLLQLLANLTYTAGSPANLVGDVNVSQLNATKLGYCGSAGGGSTNAGAGNATASASGAPWSDTPLDFSTLRTLALNLKVQLAGVSCASFPLQNASFKLQNTPSQLDVNDLQLALENNQGTMAGNISLVHAGTPKLNTQLKITNLQTHQLAPTLAEKGVRLPLSGALQLASQGATTRTLAQNLGGRVELTATEGQLPYTNMLGNVVALERLLQGQASLPSNGSGSVDNLGLVLALRQGLGTLETLQVATGNGAMVLNGTGQIDLPNWTIDLTLTPKLATSSGLEIPVLVRGPLTAPAIGADPAFRERLTKRLATEGVKALFGVDKEGAKGLGGVVTDVLGGKGLTNEGVGNLLNQFVKPKATPAAAPSPTPAEPPASVITTPEAVPPTAVPAEPTAKKPEDLLLDALPGLLGQ